MAYRTWGVSPLAKDLDRDQLIVVGNLADFVPMLPGDIDVPPILDQADVVPGESVFLS